MTCIFFFCLQLTVRAIDNGSPNKLQSGNVATVTIKVNRNNNPPIFQNLPAVRSVPRNSGSNFLILDVNATDADSVVSIT